jgi:hypothetical protein
MGTPSSGLIAEMFLQHIEHLHLTHRHKIINYFRYVDNILLIFDSIQTNLQAILDDFNAPHSKIAFYGRSGKRSHSELSRHLLSQNPYKYKNLCIQEADLH